MNAHSLLVMYVGNLEAYQGIDLLLESFAIMHRERPQDRLAVIGGTPQDIARYRDQAERLGLSAVVEFRGPKSVAQLARLLAEADILVSPRIKGTNTPMKIYSYMDAERPIVATRMTTHTQVLDDATAALAEPNPQAFADALIDLARDPDRRARLAAAAHRRVRERHSPAALKENMHTLYQRAAALMASSGPG
jgi:glycosyltransferase involved in cell wall biosynthesis